MATTTPGAVPPPDAAALLKPTPDDMGIGKEDAPVTIIEYASLTCPHCARFATETLPQLQKEYIDAGKVRLIYRDFPLNGLALRASILALCAGKERYFGFVETLFQSQATWEEAEDPEAALMNVAKLGGIGKDQYDHCMADDSLAQRVTKSRVDAEKVLEVESTPTFFINGKKFAGARPLEDFEAAINPLLPKP